MLPDPCLGAEHACTQAEKAAEDELLLAEKTLVDDLTSFGKGFTVVERVRHLALASRQLLCCLLCPKTCSGAHKQEVPIVAGPVRGILHGLLILIWTLCLQGLLAELQKDERNVEGVITADLKSAESFLEGIENRVCACSCSCCTTSLCLKPVLIKLVCLQYKLPKFTPFKNLTEFRFPWDRATAAQIPVPGSK